METSGHQPNSNGRENERSVPARERWTAPELVLLDLSAARGFFCSKTNDSSKDLGPMNCS